MSYIGNQVTSVPHVVDLFSGDNATTTFGPMVRAPAGTAAIAVFISGSYKTPGVDYVLNGEYILFFTPPSSGTSNIVIHHLGNGTSTQVPSDGSVTGTKLASNSISGNNIGSGAVSGNQIGSGAVSGNQIGSGAISGNQIGSGAISGNQIGSGAISGNQIGLYAVSGNQIGTGAISANNFAGGGITSNVLSSNLQISTSRVAETLNVVTSSIGGNYDIHIANSSVYYFLANTTANVTFNIRANTQNTLDSIISIGQSASLAVALKQGSTRYRANIYIDGTLQTAYWLGNSQPLYQTSQSQSIDAYNFTILKTSSNTYTVMASNSTFGQANGQGVGGATQ